MNAQTNQTEKAGESLANAVAASKAEIERREKLLIEIENRGETDGKRIKAVADDAEKAVSKVTREVLTEAARDFQGDDTKIRHYLAGLRKAFDNPTTAKQRASEYKAIILATSKEPEQVMQFGGGYHALVTLAREINNADRKSPAKPKNPRVTDKAIESIGEKVKVMNPAQAKLVAVEALSQIQATSPNDWELQLLIQLDGICTRLGQSKQPIFKNLAQEIQEKAARILNTQAIEAAKQSAPAQAKAA